jgi:hypothetical protein
MVTVESILTIIKIEIILMLLTIVLIETNVANVRNLRNPYMNKSEFIMQRMCMETMRTAVEITLLKSWADSFMVPNISG